MNDTKNFKTSEFACKCGCAVNHIDQRVIDMAQTIREALGSPVRVNSGYRCEKHNAAVGGVKGSYHTKGLAADLASPSKGNNALWQTIRELHAQGKLSELSYAIKYKNFVHIDCGNKRKGMWEIRS